ncbi:hypothetical protein ACWEKM_14490 [Streptomyces sp. NPDC004752]
MGVLSAIRQAYSRARTRRASHPARSAGAAHGVGRRPRAGAAASVRGVVDDFAGRAGLGQLTLARRGDTVVGPGCGAEVVADPDEGWARLLAQVGEQIDNISA